MLGSFLVSFRRLVPVRSPSVKIGSAKHVLELLEACGHAASSIALVNFHRVAPVCSLRASFFGESFLADSMKVLRFLSCSSNVHCVESGSHVEGPAALPQQLFLGWPLRMGVVVLLSACSRGLPFLPVSASRLFLVPR